jgi:hypothetical protein
MEGGPAIEGSRYVRLSTGSGTIPIPLTLRFFVYLIRTLSPAYNDGIAQRNLTTIKHEYIQYPLRIGTYRALGGQADDLETQPLLKLED